MFAPACLFLTRRYAGRYLLSTTGPSILCGRKLFRPLLIPRGRLFLPRNVFFLFVRTVCLLVRDYSSDPNFSSDGPSGFMHLRAVFFPLTYVPTIQVRRALRLFKTNKRAGEKTFLTFFFLQNKKEKTRKGRSREQLCFFLGGKHPLFSPRKNKKKNLLPLVFF